jgi:hypothetical protein
MTGVVSDGTTMAGVVTAGFSTAGVSAAGGVSFGNLVSGVAIAGDISAIGTLIISRDAESQAIGAGVHGDVGSA